MEKQLLLFEKPKNEMNGLWVSLEKVRVSQDKIRKRLFAEVGDLREQMIELRAENQRLQFHSEMKPTVRWTA